MDIGGRALRGVEQQRRRHLDEADAAISELARFEAEVSDMIDREPVAALRQRREVLALDWAEIAEGGLLELEHEGRRQRAVGLEEVETLVEMRRV